MHAWLCSNPTGIDSLTWQELPTPKPQAGEVLVLNLALLKGASIVGVFWGKFAKREPQANAAMLAQLVQWVAQGKVKPVIDRVLPLSQLKTALGLMRERAVQGKLVVIPA